MNSSRLARSRLHNRFIHKRKEVSSSEEEASKTVTPHTLRHGAAMAMLRRGVDLSVIALWLGHESTETTQMYLHADMQLKRTSLGSRQSQRPQACPLPAGGHPAGFSGESLIMPIAALAKTRDPPAKARMTGTAHGIIREAA